MDCPECQRQDDLWTITKDLLQAYDPQSCNRKKIKKLEPYIEGVLNNDFTIHMDNGGIWFPSQWTQQSIEKWNLLMINNNLYSNQMSIVCHFARYHHLMMNPQIPIPEHWDFSFNEMLCLRGVRWNYC